MTWTDEHRWCCADPDPEVANPAYYNSAIRCTNCGADWDGEQLAWWQGVPLP